MLLVLLNAGLHASMSISEISLDENCQIEIDLALLKIALSH